MLSLKGDFMDALGTTVRYDLIKQSPQYQEYLALVRQLEFVDMSTMSLQERKAFLINTYNSLVIHALVEGLLKKFPGGTLSRLQVNRHLFRLYTSNPRMSLPFNRICKIIHAFFEYCSAICVCKL
jgi:hypothetical protein